MTFQIILIISLVSLILNVLIYFLANKIGDYGSETLYLKMHKVSNKLYIPLLIFILAIYLYVIFLKNELMETLACSTMETEFNTRSALDVPTDPSQSTVLPSDFSKRYHVAVPVASASVSSVIAAAEIIPPDAEPKAVAFMRSSASFTCAPMAVSGVAGWAPS